MKKLTRKDLTGKPVVKIGYCAAHYLLKSAEKIGYTAGVYGWNADVYETDIAYILTGYRFTGIRGTYAAGAILDTAEKTAEKIFSACRSAADYEIFNAAAAVYLKTVISASLLFSNM